MPDNIQRKPQSSTNNGQELENILVYIRKVRHKSVETKIGSHYAIGLEKVKSPNFKQTYPWPFRVLQFLVQATLEFVQGN